MACASAAFLFGIALTSAHASTSSLDQWFESATQFDTNGTGAAIAKPDFLGTSMRTNCHWDTTVKLPPLHGGLWQLQKYDRTHHIALAVATTDQCTGALFRASTPPVTVPDADLSNYATARGLKIGSPYSKVHSTYGGPAMTGRNFVARYTANVPDTTAAGKPAKDPQVITIVVDDGHVSAITIYIDLGGLY